MSQPEWEGLESEVRDLARRVSRIEHELGLASSRAAAGAAPVPARAEPAAEGGPVVPAGLLPVLGRALLGLAGAYLLRALTEGGTLPHRVGVAIGIVYAVAWLVWAARTPAEKRAEAALYSLTSALVLAPLLWEATIRFHAISTGTAAALLLLFTVFGLTVSWRKDLLMVATIATLAGLGTAAALLIASHDVMPFTWVFLAIAAAVEISACLDHWLSERWLAATAADLAVLLATWLVSNPRGLPETYAPIPHGWLMAAQVSLLAIYLASTIVRTLFRRSAITYFEMAQCALAFGMCAAAGLSLVILLCGAACYAVAFLRLDSHGRNFHAYSTFGILLVLAGSRIVFPFEVSGPLWLALAVGCVWAGGAFGRLTLAVHGTIYLLLSVGLSGALLQAGEFVVGAATWPGTQDLALGIGASAAALCYVVSVRYTGTRGEWNFQTLRLALTGTLAWLLAGIAAGFATAAYHAVFGQAATHAYCATLRTTVVSIAALLLAWGGSRWNNLEFLRLIYPAMILGAYRLVMHDLRQEHTVAFTLSLLVYGATLMALPRLKRAAGAVTSAPVS
jgi:hypothetical protein